MSGQNERLWILPKLAQHVKYVKQKPTLKHGGLGCIVHSRAAKD